MGAAVFKGMNSIKTGSRHDSAKLDELVDVIQWPKNKYHPFRILPIMPLHVRQVWIKLWAGKDKKDKREVNIPRFAIDFNPSDPETPKKGVKCPFMALAAKFKGQKDAPVRASDFWLFNVISRDVQEEGPPRKASKPTKEEKKTGFKDINSETWTPVRVARLTMTSINRLQELSEDNEVKSKKTGKKQQYDVSDAKYGFDVKLKFKPDASGTDKYTLDRASGGTTPLTAEEQSYLTWNLTEELLDAAGRMTEKQAKEDVKRMEIVGGEELDDDDDEKPKKKKKGKSTSLDDDEEDEKPKKKKKGKVNFDDDDEEDEKPKKKKKSSDKPTKSKKKSKPDDDEDDEKPKKKKKSSDKGTKSSGSKVKKKSKSDDDEKPKKKKKSSDKDDKKGGAKKKAKTSTKKKKSDWDDED